MKTLSDGIDLQEPAEGRGVDAGLVVVHAQFGQPSLAVVLEAAGVGRAGDAVLVVGVVGVDVAAQHDAGGVILGRQPVAVVQVGGGRRGRAGAAEQPAQRIPGQGRAIPAADQPGSRRLAS